MGLFAAALMLSFRLPEGSQARTRLQYRAARVLIPSLLPLLTTPSGGQIDYGAHFGGAISGALVALFLLKSWPGTSSLPRFRGVAATIAAVGLLVTGASVVMAAANYPAYKAIFSLIPANEVPKTQQEILDRDRATRLLARYPQDPRTHLYMGEVLFMAADHSGAEKELRIGLEQAEKLRSLLKRQLGDHIRVTLAQVLIADNRREEARDIARSLCQTPPETTLDPETQRILAANHLCD